MRGVVVFDHLDRRATILCDLIDVGTFKKPHADVCMPEAVGGASIAVPVKLQIEFRKNAVELLLVVYAENLIFRFRCIPFDQTFERAHRIWCALAISDTALAAHFNFEDALVQ